MEFIFLLIAIIFFSACNINKHFVDNEYLLTKNSIRYNGTAIDNAELEGFIRQKPNRKIIKAFRFNLGLDNQVDQQKMLKKKEKRDLIQYGANNLYH